MNAFINGIAYYLPEKVVDNAVLSQEHPEWSVEKISTKTGINARHIAAENEFSSDMAVTVADRFLSENNIDRSSIDYLLLCTQSPDYFLPTTACLVHERLGLAKSCGAIDFNLGCSGYVYGLGLAKGLIYSSQATNVLLITAETYSKFLHPQDKSNKTLFGDAASATLVTATADSGALQGDIRFFKYGTDGAGGEKLIVKNGGMRNRFAKGEDVYEGDTFVRNDDYLFMDGKAIFEFTAFKIPQLITDTLTANNLKMEEVDLFVFHQANAFMLNTVRKRIGIPEEKFYIYLGDCGNTVSATIPIALHHAMKHGAIKKGYKVLLAGFGVGLSWGATVLEF